MLTKEENELLTHIGPGTPMGNMLRRYWIPACLSEEIPEPDGTPKRVRLLGENLVAFRDSNGRIGLIEEYCPHRGASLVFGRNEESGIRCLYHGWKIDVEGNLVDTPVEPAGSDLKHKIKHLAYPTHEQGDMVWAYMGPREKVPAFPNFEWTTVPKVNRVVAKIREEANWVQALEGAIDSSHASVLHDGWLLPNSISIRPTRDTAPKLEVQETPYGFRYAAIRKPLKEPDKYKYVRVTLFAAPFHCFVPPKGYGSMHIFVPIDDEHTWFYGVNFSQDRALDHDEMKERRGAVIGVDLDQNYRKIRTLENNFLQDRAAMKAKSSFTGTTRIPDQGNQATFVRQWSSLLGFTGIRGVPAQDMAMQESMGPIYDRTKEHLGSSDIAIFYFRRRMLNGVRSFMADGKPIGLDPSIPYERLRSAEKVVPIDTPWQEVGAFAGEAIPTAA